MFEYYIHQISSTGFSVSVFRSIFGPLTFHFLQIWLFHLLHSIKQCSKFVFKLSSFSDVLHIIFLFLKYFNSSRPFSLRNSALNCCLQEISRCIFKQSSTSHLAQNGISLCKIQQKCSKPLEFTLNYSNSIYGKYT